MTLAFNCPVCGGPTQRLFVKNNYGIHDCARCGHRAADLATTAAHVVQIYGDHYFHGGGDGYPDYLAEGALLQAHGRRYGALLQRYLPVGRVLDVGAAAGFVLSGLQTHGWQGVGLEPNAQMADYGRRRLGLTMGTGDLERSPLQGSGERFDLVTMIQVIAHFYDLRQALAQAAALTRPGGYWLIESWDYTSWPARLLGENWHEYSPPSVLHWFSPQGLTALAAQFGMTPVASGRPRKDLNGAHAKSLLRHKVQGTAAATLFNRPLDLIPDEFPIPYPAFDLFWSLFRKVENE